MARWCHAWLATDASCVTHALGKRHSISSGSRFLLCIFAAAVACNTCSFSDCFRSPRIFGEKFYFVIPMRTHQKSGSCGLLIGQARKISTSQQQAGSICIT
eukprot:scaffold236602_cov22-Prasinocladus_malaysianus.AAC.2